MRERVLLVVQRYGDGVSGGAEAHARELVRHLKPHVEVEVATTTALDYWTWRHELVPGDDAVDGVPVKRFKPASGRARNFRRYERAAFSPQRTLDDERAFLRAQGPHCPELLGYVERRAKEVDLTIFFTYIYEPTALGLPLAPERSVLVPTAHDEPALALSIYKPVFHAARAIAFNTEEERAMVHARFRSRRVPNDVVGVGVDLPERADARRFREQQRLDVPFFLYVGRIVESKGMPELFDHWARWRAASTSPAKLVLLGRAEMAVPVRGDVIHLGSATDQEKWDAYAGCAAFLMPSRLESLSMVTLEAWAMSRPTVCSARSPVLASMGRRANASLPYASAAEFAEICELLVEKPEAADALGRNGRAFVERTYTWDLVVEKYLDLFAEVRARNS